VRCLLDTHTFLWWDVEPDKLSPRVLSLLEDRTNLLFLSMVSVWEMQIKMQLGKLHLQRSLGETVRSQGSRNGIVLMPIRLEHITALAELPLHHKDPFDRLLVAQAKTESTVLLSKDRAFGDYAVPVVW